MTIKKYETTAVYQEINSLLMELRDKNRVELNPNYQRGDVWPITKRSKYIESLYKGIAPTPCIFNYYNGVKTCMDGKQRILSIRKFVNNEYAFELDETGEIIFYKEVKKENLTKDQLDAKNIRAMTIEERDNFDTLKIPTITYKNLTYSEQVDIFHRIQNGVALSIGELTATLFSKEKLSEMFIKFCDSKLKVMRKYADSKRKSHHNVIANAMYICAKNVLKDINKNIKQEFFTNLENENEFQNHINTTSKIIDTVYGDELLSHSSMKVTIKKNLQLCLMYFIVNNKNINYNVLRKVVTEIDNTKENGGSTVKKLSEIYAIMCEKYNKNNKNTKKKDSEISDESDNDNSDNEDDSENDSDEKPKNAQKSKTVKKTIMVKGKRN